MSQAHNICNVPLKLGTKNMASDSLQDLWPLHRTGAAIRWPLRLGFLTNLVTPALEAAGVGGKPDRGAKPYVLQLG